MTLYFDHIMHYVSDPLQVTRELHELGINNKFGGDHSRGGTFNTLSYFGLKYIEYIGIKDEKAFAENISKLPKFSPISKIVNRRDREGIISIALRSHNLKKISNFLQKKGAAVEGPQPLSRKTPEGNTLSWELLYAGVEDTEIPLPFFIDWKLADIERIANLVESGYITPHEKGELEIANIVFAVNSFEHSIDKWKSFLDLEEIKLDKSFNEEVEYRTLTLDDVNFIFVKPKEEGKIKSFLENEGPGIYQLDFRGAKKEEELIIHNAIYHFYQ